MNTVLLSLVLVYFIKIDSPRSPCGERGRGGSSEALVGLLASGGVTTQPRASDAGPGRLLAHDSVADGVLGRLGLPVAVALLARVAQVVVVVLPVHALLVTTSRHDFPSSRRCRAEYPLFKKSRGSPSCFQVKRTRLTVDQVINTLIIFVNRFL